ncbi:LamG-like jellyroll fold domain-containing protein, partial [Streptomyces scabiei]|uniref:LamG-like jellyroll fold domain-containing protein n=1 Tax=Streptomyces scabiei TaxID=1930 RepID=UPI0038F696E7
MSVPGATSLAFTQDGPLTISAWVRPAAMQRDAVLYSRRDGANALLIGFDDGAPFFEVTTNGTTQRSAGAAPVAPGGWHHV